MATKQPTLQEQYSEFEGLAQQAADDIAEANELKATLSRQIVGGRGLMGNQAQITARIRALDGHIRALRDDQRHHQQQMSRIQGAFKETAAKEARQSLKDQSIEATKAAAEAKRQERAYEQAQKRAELEASPKFREEQRAGAETEMRDLLAAQRVQMPSETPRGQLFAPSFAGLDPMGIAGGKPGQEVVVSMTPNSRPEDALGSEAARINAAANNERTKAVIASKLRGLDPATFLNLKPNPQGMYVAALPPKGQAIPPAFTEAEYQDATKAYQDMLVANAEKPVPKVPGTFALSPEAFERYKGGIQGMGMRMGIPLEAVPIQGPPALPEQLNPKPAIPSLGGLGIGAPISGVGLGSALQASMPPAPDPAPPVVTRVPIGGDPYIQLAGKVARDMQIAPAEALSLVRGIQKEGYDFDAMVKAKGTGQVYEDIRKAYLKSKSSPMETAKSVLPAILAPVLGSPEPIPVPVAPVAAPAVVPAPAAAATPGIGSRIMDTLRASGRRFLHGEAPAGYHYDSWGVLRETPRGIEAQGQQVPLGIEDVVLYE